MELLLLAILGLVMGFVTSVSGGAGVFAVPTMLAFGIPPINALTLNRFSDVGVVFGAANNYWKAKVVDWSLAIKHGDGFIKKGIIVIGVIMILKVIFQF